MFKIQTKLGIPCYIAMDGENLTTDSIKEDYAYVICQQGAFLKRKNFMYEGFFKMKNVDFLGGVEDAIRAIDIKIPYQLFLSIESFFQEIYDKRKTEVAVLLYYNPDTKKWLYCVPQQTVSAASVNYDIAKGATYVHEDNLEEGPDKLPEGNWMQVGSIHSHAGMSAFHSGTDDKDEFGFDGIHITIGGFNKPVHEYACRTMYGTTDMKKKLEEVVDCPTVSGRRPGNLDAMVAEPEVKTVQGFNGIHGSIWNKGTGYGKNYGGAYPNGYRSWDESYVEGARYSKPEKKGKGEYPFTNGTVFINQGE